MSKKQRPSTRLVKQILFQRYGKVCMVCEKKFDSKYLQYHHIVEFSKGGATDVENGAILCPTCHAILHREKRYEYNRKIKVFKETH